jgi:hypothetical protein
MNRYSPAADVKATSYMAPNGDGAYYLASEVDARIAELVKVLEAAVDDDGGISYAHSTDLIGYHLCCGTISYDPHHDSCWVSLARAVLKESK